MQIGPWFASSFQWMYKAATISWLLRNWQCVLKVFYGLFNHKIIAVLWLVPIPTIYATLSNWPPPQPTKPTQQTNRNKETETNLISPTEFYARFYCSSLCLEWIRFVSSNKSCQHSISSGNYSVPAQSALISDNVHPEQLYQKHLRVVEWTGTAFSGEQPKLLLMEMTLAFLLEIFFFLKYSSKLKLFEFWTHHMLCYHTTKLHC